MSVVVAGRNCADVLPEQLQALSRQSYSGGWEVIFVDNGSSDGTAAVVRQWADELPGLRVISAPARACSSYARNVGTAAARAPLVAYCDADDRVSPAWLQALVRQSEVFPLVGGSFELTALNDPQVRHWYWIPEGVTVLGEVPSPFLPFASSSNLLARVDVIDQVGGWSEGYRRGYDADLSWRAQLAGFQLGGAPDAVVHYRLRPTIAGIARQRFADGRFLVQLYAEYRARGMPRSSVAEAARAWGWILTRWPAALCSRRRRGRWVSLAAMRCGLLRGSVRYRSLYL